MTATRPAVTAQSIGVGQDTGTVAAIGNAAGGRLGWRMGVAWIACSAIGVALGAVVTAGAIARGRASGISLAALGTLVAVATMQWFVFRRFRHPIAWWSWVGSAVAGSLAAAVVSFVVVLVPPWLALVRMLMSPLGPGAVGLATTVLIGVAGGAATGLVTAAVLRRHFAGMMVWVAINAVAGAVAAALAATFVGTPSGAPNAAVASRLSSGVVWSCLTGLAVALLVRRVEPNASGPGVNGG